MCSSYLQVELVGMSFVGLKAVVDFLYSGELPLDGGNIDYVLEAAHLLQVRNQRAVRFNDAGQAAASGADEGNRTSSDGHLGLTLKVSQSQ